MSGHSKWANIKHKKGKTDALKAKMATKIGREITVAARMGGADPTGNMRLKLALQKARENNIPKDNIQRAIDKGVGATDMNAYEEIVYEGYGPAGVAVTVEVMTDNRNRAAADVRHAFSKQGGNLGESGCVGWMFKSLQRQRFHLNFENASSAANLPSENDFYRWAWSALKNEYRRADISLILLDEEEARAYNRDYRGKDYATNVLSFALNEGEILPDQFSDGLYGDLVICPQVVLKEAA